MFFPVCPYFSGHPFHNSGRCFQLKITYLESILWKMTFWEAYIWILVDFLFTLTLKSKNVVLNILLPWQRTNQHIKSFFRFTTNISWTITLPNMNFIFWAFLEIGGRFTQGPTRVNLYICSLESTYGFENKCFWIFYLIPYPRQNTTGPGYIEHSSETESGSI